LPGPHEQTGDEVQKVTHICVNELLRLWKHGFLVKTKRYPEGRLVFVILICIICDKPAAHKLGGFGSHSHTFFCHLCWIQKSEKATAAAFQHGGMFVYYSARPEPVHIVIIIKILQVSYCGDFKMLLGSSQLL